MLSDHDEEYEICACIERRGEFESTIPRFDFLPSDDLVFSILSVVDRDHHLRSIPSQCTDNHFPGSFRKTKFIGYEATFSLLRFYLDDVFIMQIGEQFGFTN